MKLVLASHNQGKLEELSAILEPAVAGLELVSYDGPEPVEDGTSYLENALIKARAAHAHTGLPAIADDSGIAVEILGGSPGIFTAIWSGTKDNVANRQLLLAQLKDIHEEHRGGDDEQTQRHADQQLRHGVSPLSVCVGLIHRRGLKNKRQQLICAGQGGEPDVPSVR
mgnify:CR=1 FL=1